MRWRAAMLALSSKEKATEVGSENNIPVQSRKSANRNGRKTGPDFSVLAGLIFCTPKLPLILASLVHECLQAGLGVGLLLSVISHI